MCLATPVHNGGIMMLHPFTIGFMVVDRDAAECTAPLHHACVVVRMRNRDGRQSAESLHNLNSAGVNQAEAVPENPAMLRLHQQYPLRDGKIRFGVNSPELLALF